MEFLQIIGVVCLLLIFVYMSTQVMKLQRHVFIEGFGLAGDSEEFSKNIKAKYTKLHDQLLVKKYRTNYENTVLNMDDYINTLMLDCVLQIDLDKDSMPSFEKLNTLNAAKQSLNSVMKFIDSSS
jgi:hypothetical protein